MFLVCCGCVKHSFIHSFFHLLISSIAVDRLPIQTQIPPQYFGAALYPGAVPHQQPPTPSPHRMELISQLMPVGQMSCMVARLAFSQEDVDMVLYGYSKSGDGEEESQGHALSGLQLGNKLRHGEITCGFIFPFYIYIYLYIYISIYIYIYIYIFFIF